MAPTKPTPTSLTLFLKLNRTTIVLPATPISSLSALKSQLLSALQSRYPDGIDAAALPKSAEEIQIATPITVEEGGETWSPVEGNDSLAALGFKDGNVLAFKLSEEEDWRVDVPQFDDEEEEE